MDDPSMDAVFRALASETRRRILDVVRNKPGCGVAHVTARFTVSRISVLKHLRVLEDAGLLISESSDARLLNCVPIQIICDAGRRVRALWANKLTEMKYRVESKKEKKDDG
jgi:predicted transcriptional regulator